jgi:hypothetical protein
MFYRENAESQQIKLKVGTFLYWQLHETYTINQKSTLALASTVMISDDDKI